MMRSSLRGNIGDGAVSFPFRRVEDGRLLARRQRLSMAARDKKGRSGGEGEGEGDKEKGGFFGGFFGGNKDGEEKSAKAAKKTAKKAEEGGEGEGPLKSLSKRIFQRRSSDDSEEGDAKGKKKEKEGKGKKRGGKDKGEGVVVDASTFVGPTLPSPSNVNDLKTRREEELRRKDEQRIRAQAEAARKAKEAAEERERKLEEKLREVQRERDRKEMQKVIMKASQTSRNGEAKGPTPAPKESAKEGAGGGEGPGVIKSTAGFVTGVWDSVFNKNKGPKEEWIVVCPKTRIAPGEIVPVTVAGLSLLVVVSRDGRSIHAISNSCPHLGTPLDTGLVERRLKPGVEVPPGTDASKMGSDCFEECVVCPLHNTAFELNSGEVRGEWCPYPPVIGKVMGTVKPKTNLPKFDIRTRGKNVEIKINTSLE
uniref:Rieske domain-containing protein n=1 Tax=Odontella aurita TaxID=265563 RepID=A0A7S4JB76_9STRA|mmetsp:Transcript_42997/g.130898  ORF Transcript_42997/g.130898 Transcript_42997/m.130898 type:complete len:423 (+) Transcript_42997:1410-2678(+)